VPTMLLTLRWTAIAAIIDATSTPRVDHSMTP
jgi:hypothetical protein